MRVCIICFCLSLVIAGCGAVDATAGAVGSLFKPKRKAKTQLEIITKRPSQSAIDQSFANMLLAENKLNKTLESIEDIKWQQAKISSSQIPSEIRKGIVKALRRAMEGLEFQRTQDQLAYNRSVSKYEPDLADQLFPG